MPSERGTAIGVMAAGGILLWSALFNKTVTQTIADIVRGKKPTPGPSQPSPVTPGGGKGGTPPAPPSGKIYNHAQLMQLWESQGGSTTTANNAACHAIQESGGNPNATSANPDGGTNVGLWQLDTPGGVGGGHTIAELQNPILNAQLTIQATNGGQNWSQWSTPGC